MFRVPQFVAPVSTLFARSLWPRQGVNHVVVPYTVPGRWAVGWGVVRWAEGDPWWFSPNMFFILWLVSISPKQNGWKMLKGYKEWDVCHLSIHWKPKKIMGPWHVYMFTVSYLVDFFNIHRIWTALVAVTNRARFCRRWDTATWESTPGCGLFVAWRQVARWYGHMRGFEDGSLDA